VRGQPGADTEVRVVLEQRVAPRRTAPLGVRGPGRRRQIAAVDRRTTRRVRDNRAIAEQLRHQLDVWSLAASNAGAGELEQWPLQLLMPDQRGVQQRAIRLGHFEKELPVLLFLFDEIGLRLHVERLALGNDLALCRTYIDTDAAARA